MGLGQAADTVTLDLERLVDQAPEGDRKLMEALVVEPERDSG